jgi:2-polyprenyl-3-methyl-5-hydroxy-6-metoxy-1,4-benzoquinol methylase
MLDVSESKVTTDPKLCEPDNNGRDTPRLLHDLGAMLSLLTPTQLSEPFLDFGAGTCWITETLARMGHRVTAFDIHDNLEECISGRVSSDSRLDGSLINYVKR